MVMASDGCQTTTPKFEDFALSISVATEAEADRKFNALSDGGKSRCVMPGRRRISPSVIQLFISKIFQAF